MQILPIIHWLSVMYTSRGDSQGGSDESVENGISDSLPLWAAWRVRGSCCGTLRKLCLTKQARFSQTAATRSGRFICRRQRSHRSPYERSSGALWYFLARKKVHYTYSRPCFTAEKSLTTEVVRLVFALPIFPGGASRLPPVAGGRRRASGCGR